MRPWALLQLGIQEEQQSKIHGRVPLPLERGLQCSGRVRTVGTHVGCQHTPVCACVGSRGALGGRPSWPSVASVHVLGAHRAWSAESCRGFPQASGAVCNQVGGQGGITASPPYPGVRATCRPSHAYSRYVMYRSRWAIRSRNALFSASACASRASNRTAKYRLCRCIINSGRFKRSAIM